MDRECFICLSPNNIITNRDRSFYIEFTSYRFDCKCITYTHDACMKKWIHYSQICPICRTNLHSHQNKVIILVTNVFVIITTRKIFLLFLNLYILFFIVKYGIILILEQDFDTI
jgi:hypothetical protein